MKITTKYFLYGTIFGIFLFQFGIFIYNNIIAPYPHRHELKDCLSEARSLDSESEIEKAENICFRTIPHFL